MLARLTRYRYQDAIITPRMTQSLGPSTTSYGLGSFGVACPLIQPLLASFSTTQKSTSCKVHCATTGTVVRHESSKWLEMSNLGEAELQSEALPRTTILTRSKTHTTQRYRKSQRGWLPPPLDLRRQSRIACWDNLCMLAVDFPELSPQQTLPSFTSW